MPSFKRLLHRRLTLTSGLVVVLTLCLLTGTLYGLYKLTLATVLRVRVHTSTAKVLTSIQADRDQILKAIEAYRSHFGFYPPDHVLTQQPLRIDPITNQLFYELAGTIYDSTNGTFAVDGIEALRKQVIRDYFNCDRIRNADLTRDRLKRFLPADHFFLREIHDDPDVMVLACGYVEGVDYEVFSEFQISSWKYVSSAPTNNPGRFDLWMEVEASGKKFIVGNWGAKR